MHKITVDRRRYQRVRINLLGRFMRENKNEYPCRLLNISPGSVALMAPVAGELDESIIVYFDHLGRIEGRLTRVFEGGFALVLNASLYKREKLAEQLTWLANRSSLNLVDDRKHDRVMPNNVLQTLAFPDGNKRQCRILDVSISGASVALKDRPEIGLEIMLGRMRGKVVRHHKQGIGIEFMDIQNPNALRKHFG
ncbi:MAG: PilZ domain-containing protein [Pseudomonadota bacterium]